MIIIDDMNNIIDITINPNNLNIQPISGLKVVIKKPYRGHNHYLLIGSYSIITALTDGKFICQGTHINGSYVTNYLFREEFGITIEGVLRSKKDYERYFEYKS